MANSTPATPNASVEGQALQTLLNVLATSQSPDMQPTQSALPITSPRKGSEEEHQWIISALDRAGGNQTIAARMLGISRRTLINRLNECKEIPRPRKGKKPQREA